MHEDPIDYDQDLDARVIRALERRPEPSIPTDFAARVAAKVPARRVPVAIVPTHYGRNAVWVGMAAALLALVVLAPRVQSQSLLWIGVDWMLSGQFLALGIWWSSRRDESN